MRSRSTLVAAKSQQRPLAFWLVTSSVGTSTENFWRMAPAPLEQKATLFSSLLERASVAMRRSALAS